MQTSRRPSLVSKLYPVTSYHHFAPPDLLDDWPECNRATYGLLVARLTTAPVNCNQSTDADLRLVIFEHYSLS
jgi:hypothetical protein